MFGIFLFLLYFGCVQSEGRKLCDKPRIRVMISPGQRKTWFSRTCPTKAGTLTLRNSLKLHTVQEHCLPFHIQRLIHKVTMATDMPFENISLTKSCSKCQNVFGHCVDPNLWIALEFNNVPTICSLWLHPLLSPPTHTLQAATLVSHPCRHG